MVDTTARADDERGRRRARVVLDEPDRLLAADARPLHFLVGAERLAPGRFRRHRPLLRRESARVAEHADIHIRARVAEEADVPAVTETALALLLFGLGRVDVVAQGHAWPGEDPCASAPVALRERDPVPEDRVLEGAWRERRRGRRSGRTRCRRGECNFAGRGSGCSDCRRSVSSRQ